MTRPGMRPKAGRVCLLDLPGDPEAAFRIRAAADCDELLKLKRSIRSGVTPSRMKRCLAELAKLAHGLAGTGGVFGFPEVSLTAAKLERLAERYADLDTASLDRRRIMRIGFAIESLIEPLDRVFLRGKENHQ